MERSTYVILLVSLLGMFKEFRPSEIFLTPFLNGPKNFTEQEINYEIMPVTTYSNLVFLVFAFFLTDYMKYKPLILLLFISGAATFSLMLVATSLTLMQVAQVLNGLFCACEVPFGTYLYASVSKEHYLKGTALNKAAVYIGETCSGLVGQLTIMYCLLDYTQLNYLTISALVLGTVVAVSLPPVQKAKFSPVPQDDTVQDLEQLKLEAKAAVDEPEPDTGANNNKFAQIFVLWKIAMRNGPTLKWSIWTAVTICINTQAIVYIQLLWQEVINSEKNILPYHGFTNSFICLAGALCSYGVSCLSVDWTRYGEVVLGAGAVIQGALLLLVSNLRAGLVYHYVIYSVFRVLTQCSSVVPSAEIAKSLKSASFGAVFGANQLLALSIQSVLTVLVVNMLSLSIRMQYLCYGLLYLTIGLFFAVLGAVSIFKKD